MQLRKRPSATNPVAGGRFLCLRAVQTLSPQSAHMMLMSKYKNSLGVDWILPGRKRRFATTTVATSDLIVMIADDGHTVESAIEAINFDNDAIAVLKHFLTSGFGARQLSELVA